MRILVVLSASPYQDQALSLAELAARRAEGTVTLVAVAPDPSAEATLRQSLSRTLTAEQQAALKIRRGHFYQQVQTEIADEDYDLALIGADPRAGELPRRTLPAARLAILWGIPLGIVRARPRQWTSLLICTREADLLLPTIRTARDLASRLGLEPVILNVLPGDTEAPPSAPVQPEPEIKIRRGPLIREIQAEIESGGHEIAVVGAHDVPVGMPETGPTMALPDITRRILELELPMVIVVGHVTAPALAPAQRTVRARQEEWQRVVRQVAVELLIYAALVVAYAAVAFHLLTTPLETSFKSNPVLYAVIALVLIVGQGTLLEALTSFLLNRLRLERFD